MLTLQRCINTQPPTPKVEIKHSKAIIRMMFTFSVPKPLTLIALGEAMLFLILNVVLDEVVNNVFSY